MATFPAITPAYGAEKRSAPVMRRVQFGDGYEQRLRYGLNQNPKTWALTWNNITEANADTIEAFLDARAADGDSFDWSPPDEQAVAPAFLLLEDGDFLLLENGDKFQLEGQTTSGGSSYKWVCEEWSKSIPYTGRAVITATFRQVFEP
jgi:phage-related protein